MLLYLQFSLSSLGLCGLDRLHESKSRSLDGGHLLILLRHEALVFLLKLLYLTLEFLLGGLQLCLLSGDGGGKILITLSHKRLNLGFLVSITEINVGGGAHGLKILLGEGEEGIVVTSTLVVVKGGGVSVFKSGESLYAVGVTEVLSFGGTVNLSDESSGVSLKLSGELLPIRGHLLAVSTPRSEELDEYGLSISYGIVSIRSKRRNSSAGGSGGKSKYGE
mmetsp:Transcript_11994/g.17495  ORF Transcript_11994/g.17495 Transcript_11994/m.17495 type:complete len:221 (+) Transcript_11994:144-806(+)